MLGLSIISTSELQRLRDVDQLFSEKVGKLNDENFRLKEELEKQTPKRDGNGKFVKK